MVHPVLPVKRRRIGLNRKIYLTSHLLKYLDIKLPIRYLQFYLAHAVDFLWAKPIDPSPPPCRAKLSSKTISAPWFEKLFHVNSNLYLRCNFQFAYQSFFFSTQQMTLRLAKMVYTVCPRSLVNFDISTCHIKMNNTFWTCST